MCVRVCLCMWFQLNVNIVHSFSECLNKCTVFALHVRSTLHNINIALSLHNCCRLLTYLHSTLSFSLSDLLSLSQFFFVRSENKIKIFISKHWSELSRIVRVSWSEIPNSFKNQMYFTPKRKFQWEKWDFTQNKYLYLFLSNSTASTFRTNCFV